VTRSMRPEPCRDLTSANAGLGWPAHFLVAVQAVSLGWSPEPGATRCRHGRSEESLPVPRGGCFRVLGADTVERAGTAPCAILQAVGFPKDIDVSLDNCDSLPTVGTSPVLYAGAPLHSSRQPHELHEQDPQPDEHTSQSHVELRAPWGCTGSTVRQINIFPKLLSLQQDACNGLQVLNQEQIGLLY
jgi:hypothetical protein